MTTHYDTDFPTFEALAAAEPLLGALERAVQEVRDAAPDRPFCANAVWYQAFKPLMVHLVGAERGYPLEPALDPAAEPRPLDLDTLMDKPEGKRAPVGDNLWERALRDPITYDLVYDHLYGMLPACRDCSCA